MAKRITSPGDLKVLQEQVRNEIDLRTGQKEMRVTVHMGTCGIAAGARDVLAAFMDEMGRNGVSNVSLQQTGCAGLCNQEPMVTLTDKHGAAFRYGCLDKRKVGEIVREHVLRNLPLDEYLIRV